MTPVVRVRPSVKFAVLRPAGVRILSAIDQAALSCGFDLEITCGSEGHGPNDPHTLGEAIDVGARDLTPQQVGQVYNALRRVLGAAFTVLYERPDMPADEALAPITYVNEGATGPHFHVQRKRGTTFPPGTVDA